MSFPLPPPTRAFGTGNPPLDVDQIINAITGMGALRTLGPSGDTSGAADTAAVNAVISAIGASGGTIFLGPGTYYWTCGSVVIARAGVNIAGAGSWATVIMGVGTGDVIRMYSSAVYTSGMGGGVRGLTVDGTNCGAGSAGIHAGDIYQLNFWDAGCRFFQGTGSKGWWFDNQYFWCEDMYGHIWAQQNTAHVVFDNSANVSGTATNSFARTLLDIVLDCKGVGDGVTLQNGVEIYDGKLGIYGNMDYGGSQHYALNITGAPGFSFTATNASPCVFTAAGSYYWNGAAVTLTGGGLPAGFTAATTYFVVNASGATFQLAATFGGSPIGSTSTGSGTVTGPGSRIYASTLNIGMEVNAVSGTQPVTINFGSAAANSVRDCTGIIDFTGANAFASAVNSAGAFDFDGPVLGDVVLLRVTGAGAAHFSAGAIGNNAFLTTRYNQFVLAFPGSNVTGAILGTNDPGAQGANAASFANRTVTVVNSGTGSITFAATSTSHVSTGVACVIAAGMAMTFVWISGVWYPVT